MPKTPAIIACRKDLFTKEEELRKIYPEDLCLKILRIRDMYNWLIANPEAPDRDFVAEVRQRYNVSRPVAYDDMAVCKSLLPELARSAREFHRWRYNELILQTYRMAKARKDTKTMERAASSYARYNNIDSEEPMKIPYEQILIQPFTATSDPSVLGIKPIPNLQERIDSLISKYSAESADIEDISFEEVDLEFDSLYNAPVKSAQEALPDFKEDVNAL